MTTITITAELDGSIWRVETQVGAAINKGDITFILESMKMEIPVEAEAAGRVVAVNVQAGQAVQEGDVLAVIEVSDA